MRRISSARSAIWSSEAGTNGVRANVRVSGVSLSGIENSISTAPASASAET